MPVGNRRHRSALKQPPASSKRPSSVQLDGCRSFGRCAGSDRVRKVSIEGDVSTANGRCAGLARRRWGASVGWSGRRHRPLARCHHRGFHQRRHIRRNAGNSRTRPPNNAEIEEAAEAARFRRVRLHEQAKPRPAGENCRSASELTTLTAISGCPQLRSGVDAGC